MVLELILKLMVLELMLELMLLDIGKMALVLFLNQLVLTGVCYGSLLRAAAMVLELL